jgi:hypothetical protein
VVGMAAVTTGAMAGQRQNTAPITTSCDVDHSLVGRPTTFAARQIMVVPVDEALLVSRPD